MAGDHIDELRKLPLALAYRLPVQDGPVPADDAVLRVTDGAPGAAPPPEGIIRGTQPVRRVIGLPVPQALPPGCGGCLIVIRMY